MCGYRTVVLMLINLSPYAKLPNSDDDLIVTKSGDVLTINGEVFDFSSLPDGAEIPAYTIPCEWITGPVERLGGKLYLTLRLPHGPIPSLTVAFPAPIIDPPDGPLALPRDPEPEEQEADNVDA